MNLAQAKSLVRGATLYHGTAREADGTPQIYRVSGKARTWARWPDRVEIPVRRGRFEAGVIATHDLGWWHLTAQAALGASAPHAAPTAPTPNPLFGRAGRNYVVFLRGNGGVSVTASDPTEAKRKAQAKFERDLGIGVSAADLEVSELNPGDGGEGGGRRGPEDRVEYTYRGHTSNMPRWQVIEEACRYRHVDTLQEARVVLQEHGWRFGGVRFAKKNPDAANPGGDGDAEANPRRFVPHRFTVFKKGSYYYVRGLTSRDGEPDTLLFSKGIMSDDVSSPNSAAKMLNALYDLWQTHDDLPGVAEFDTPFGRFVGEGVHVRPA